MSAPPSSSPLDRARARIAREREKRTGFLDLGGLGLTEWLEELWTLDHLTGLNLGVGWLDENAGFHFAEPGVMAAENTLPPAGAQWHRLPHLRVLSLAGPRGEGSPWGDLSGLAGLTELRALDLSFTDADDLSALAGLPHLQVLDASYTFIGSLAPLAAHTALRHLDVCHTRLTDLTPLSACTALESLLVDSTRLTDLAPLAGLTALKKLHLSSTAVTTLAPLARHPALETLRLSWTAVGDLDPLATLPRLKILQCCDTPVTHVSESLVRLPSLESLILHGTEISNVPAAALSPDGVTNCLETLRAWFQKHPQA